MIKQEEVYKIGRIGKPHGINGEVHFLFDDDVFDRVESEYLILDIDGILVPFFMEEYRFRGESSALVKFCDIDTQEKARELTNCDVYFPYSLTDEDPENMRWTQIIGSCLRWRGQTEIVFLYPPTKNSFKKSIPTIGLSAFNYQKVYWIYKYRHHEKANLHPR